MSETNSYGVLPEDKYSQVKDIFGCSGLKGHASIIKNKESYKSVEDYYFGLNHALYYGEETSNINGAISLIS